jgi:cerevisin
MKSFFTIAASLLTATSTVWAAPHLQDGYIDSENQMVHGNDTKHMFIMFEKAKYPNMDIDEKLANISMSRGHKDFGRFYNNSVFMGADLRGGKHCIDGLNAMAEVAYIEEKTTIQSFATQDSGAPWGLQRISSEAGASGSPSDLDFTYTFDDEKLGAGVDIYILDTGVRTTHAVFTGRATEGFTATGSFTDGDGHGTHCAGTAGGAKFGVAQGANIIEVKVLGDDGSGASSDTIAGIDFVINQHDKRKNEPGFVGSIMSMSWGLQGRARSVDDVIAGANKAGIHVSVAAGNEGTDACLGTPSGLGGANSNIVTVGSVNIDNQVSTFSNIGKCVDIYAPGEEIISSWSTGDTVINPLSGTSMACPHTTGVMAYLMAEDPTLGQNPGALKAKLLETAREGKITGSTGGSANLLLSNGAKSNTGRRLTKNYVVPDHSGLNGSPAARAAARMADITIDKRFQLHRRDAQLRF